MHSQLVLLVLWIFKGVRTNWLRRARLVRLAVAITATSAITTGCGGGGAPVAASASAGTASVALIDGPLLDATNLWITVKEIDFHQTATANAGDGGWLQYPLPAPVSLDLNQLNNGALSQVFSNLSLPAGSYKQIRLYLAGADDALSNSALAQGLTYNDQVNFIPVAGPRAGLATVAPLEIASPTQGIGLVGTFNVAAGQALNLAIEFDVGHQVVRYKHGSMDAFTMKPVLSYFDLSQSGAIIGRIDTSACATLTNPCQNFVVKAETPSSDGTYNAVTRWTQVKSDGSFALFPLPAKGGQTYDIMLRGRNAQTIIVKGVPVSQGSTPSSSATSVSSAALPIQPSPEFAVTVAPPANPTGANVQFYQTLAAGTPPHEIRFRSLNPFTGDFTTVASNSFPLTSALPLVGNYNATGTPTLAAITPQEGAGAYLPVLSAGWFARSAAPAVSPIQSVVASPTMQAATGVAQLGTITGTITGGSGGWTNGQIVVSRFGVIVNTVDISSNINGGSYSVGNLPSGSALQPLGGGFLGSANYYAYARVWNSANTQGPNGTPKVRTVPISGIANLATTPTATLNLTLP